MYVRALWCLVVGQLAFVAVAEAQSKVRPGLLRFNEDAKSFELRTADNASWKKIKIRLTQEEADALPDDKKCNATQVPVSANGVSGVASAPLGNPSVLVSSGCRGHNQFGFLTGTAQLQCDGTSGTWKLVGNNCGFSDDPGGE